MEGGDVMQMELLMFAMNRLNGERSISGAFHLLKGKRSAQTVQDATLFQMQPLFGMFKELTEPTLSELTQQVQTSSFFVERNEAFILTEEGQVHLANWLNKHSYIEQINGWKYGTIAPLFWRRVTLLVQTLANLYANERFVPVTNDLHTQQFIKKMLPQVKGECRQMQLSLFQELKELLSQQEPIHAELFVQQLSRPRRFGLSKPQLAYQYGIPVEQVQLRHTSTLHQILARVALDNRFPLMRSLAKENQRLEGTASAKKTAALLPYVQSIEALAEKRVLKQSTIEDHLVELALLNPDFQIDRYVTSEARTEIERMYLREKTLKLKVIHDKLLGKASYFEIRLVLARKGLQSNVGT